MSGFFHVQDGRDKSERAVVYMLGHRPLPMNAGTVVRVAIDFPEINSQASLVFHEMINKKIRSSGGANEGPRVRVL